MCFGYIQNFSFKLIAYSWAPVVAWYSDINQYVTLPTFYSHFVDTSLGWLGWQGTVAIGIHGFVCEEFRFGCHWQQVRCVVKSCSYSYLCVKQKELF